MIQIISDKPVPDWLTELVTAAGEYEDLHVIGAAVGLRLDCEKDKMESLTFYTNLSLSDRTLLIGHMQYDIAYKAAKEAIRNTLGIEPDEPDRPE